MKVPTLSIILLLLVMLVITGCQLFEPFPTSNNTTVVCPVDPSMSDDPACRVGLQETVLEENETEEPAGELVSEEVQVDISAEQGQLSDVSQVITGVEGDLIELRPTAVSPEGAPITYTFSNPFNENGLWQTHDGDAGKHLVTITASDGISSVSQSVLVEISPSNKAPVIECPTEVIVDEGEKINLDCNIFDIDGDEVVVDYSGFMTGPSYETTYDDAGSYTVVVRAADVEHVTTATVPILVKNVNRAPVIESVFDDFTATETDVVTLNVNARDPDGDPITITYSTPFDEQGVWRTTVGDAGTYEISVVAADYELTTKKRATLTLKPINTAPVLKEIAPITVAEGEEVVINVEATDREDSELLITYSGFMTSSTYLTTFDDAYPNGCGVPLCNATYVVTVTVSDGFLSDSQDVLVTVVDTWRGPVFQPPQ